LGNCSAQQAQEKTLLITNHDRRLPPRSK
jgi:hypothetical protein